MIHFDQERFNEIQLELLGMGVVLDDNSLWSIGDVNCNAEWAGIDISKMTDEEKLNLLSDALERDIIAEQVNDCIKNELNELRTDK